MKRKRVLVCVALAILAVYVIAVPLRSDPRLTGTFVPDAEETLTEWKPPVPDLDLRTMFNILGQIFGEAPVRLTNRTIAMNSGSHAVTKQYAVLWRRSDGAILFVRPFTLFHVTYTSDGMWMKIIPRREQLLHVKLCRLTAPADDTPWWDQFVREKARRTHE